MTVFEKFLEKYEEAKYRFDIYIEHHDRTPKNLTYSAVVIKDSMWKYIPTCAYMKNEDYSESGFLCIKYEDIPGEVRNIILEEGLR